MNDAREPRGDDRDALLTAYAMDAITPEERSAVERLLADPAAGAERAHVAEVRATAAALRAARDAEMPERSADLRRAVLAAAVEHAAVTPAAPARPRRSGSLGTWALALGSCAAVAVLVAPLVLQSSSSPRGIARRQVAMVKDKEAAVASRPAAESPASLNQSPEPIGSPASEPAATALRKARSEKPARAIPDGAHVVQGQAAEAPAPAFVVPSEKSAATDVPAAPMAAAIARQATDRAAAEQASESQRQQAPPPGNGSAIPGPRPGRPAGDVDKVALAARGRRAIDARRESAGRHLAERPAEREVAEEADKAMANRDHDLAAGERYNRFAENRFLAVGEQPLSTFSIDVDTASYANVRRFLAAGRRPPRDAVRIEELVNYFRYDYPQPRGDAPFSVTVDAASCPWRPGHRIVRVGLAGRDVERSARPAGNLVFLVDVSGSMNDPNKLPLVKQALRMLVEELTENDRVALVTYAGNAGLVLPSTSGDQKRKILAAIDGLAAGGSTHGSAGITLAYEQAAERFIPGGANRVILCTDGDLNVGITSDEALVALISKQAKGGTFLTVLGFGAGNLQDEKMEKLADNGNGVYAYIDGVREARKVLVEQLTGSTIAIAKDVKIQVEFNPAQVASYRLLGYENRALAAEDFRDDAKDAGEIGAGHTVTALYEVVLVGEEATPSAGRGAEPLKYQPAPPAAPPATKPADEGPASRELLTVKLRWKKPDGDTSTLLEVPLAERGGAFDAAAADLRFATAVAAFGMILRGSEHVGTATLPMVAEIAVGALGGDAGGYRAEFLDLVRAAEAAR